MMRWIRQHRCGILRAIAALLALGSVCAAYFWFYQIAPFRRMNDPLWVRERSTAAYWSQMKESIRRSGWNHDDGLVGGYFADADFMAWVMARTAPGEDISSCFAGHRDTAFRMISNQDVGEQSAAWLAWWEDNRAKSQEEWIRDGFVPYGVTVQNPPSEAETIPLLSLLGKASGEEPDAIPDFVRYNAFRWLRDSGFNPVAFAMSNDADTTEAEIKTGLLEYWRYEQRFPKRDRVGVLRLSEERDPDFDQVPFAMLMHWPVKPVIYALVFGLPFVAAGLIAWTVKQPNPNAGRSERGAPGSSRHSRFLTVILVVNSIAIMTFNVILIPILWLFLKEMFHPNSSIVLLLLILLSNFVLVLLVIFAGIPEGVAKRSPAGRWPHSGNSRGSAGAPSSESR